MLVLLDRDGVLNREDGTLVATPDQLVMLPGAAAAVARITAAGWRVAVVTNQSCIGRGTLDCAALAAVHRSLCARVRGAGGRIDAVLVAPDPPWAATARRKPGAGMLLEAMHQYHTAAADTVMIGDGLTDLQAARAAGCRAILVRTGKGAALCADGIPDSLRPVAVCDDLARAVAMLLDPAL